MISELKLAVSNIAWESKNDENVAKFLCRNGIRWIEVAPTRYFPNPTDVEIQKFTALRKSWENFEISISSIQSLLFNQPSLQLFGNLNSRIKLRKHLLALSDICSALGASAMVFGAPKNRIRGSLSVKEAYLMANLVFKEMEDSWKNRETFLAFEANPKEYGCDFITKTSEALQFVKESNLQFLKWHLDTACTELGGESTIELLESTAELPAHIHLSERNLAPLQKFRLNFYSEILDILRDRQYNGYIVLEMRNTNSLSDVFDSISLLQKANRH